MSWKLALKSFPVLYTVGANNHRQYILFLIMFVLCLILFDYLTWQYSAGLPQYDTFLVVVALWAALQLVLAVLILGHQYRPFVVTFEFNIDR
ncbi:hypothetical protein L218DRAFT_960701 [Marasmius fiardii PR-910]|nr:hypothetical protein L218DRAFT_960701 [Marasmius fiardii PR-910]